MSEPDPRGASGARGSGGRRRGGNPGGSGAVLGMRLLRLSGVQGTALVVSNMLQLVSIVVIAQFLGPIELGRYALLFFLAGLTTQVLSLAVRAGTIRRTFGGGDDEDDDDEADDEVSSSPRRTLGVGLAWAALLGLAGAVAIVLARRPIADVLLGSADDERLVLYAGVLAGFWVPFKLASIVLWLERRPQAFLVADASRPVLSLAAISVLLATGAGLEGAIVGTAIGTAVAAVLAVVLLRGSFDPVFDVREVVQIVLKGGYRVPIVMSFWLTQNADVFLISRFVDPTDVGLYNLASRLGLVVAILPQGFRVAMRPLRKSAAFEAVREEYGAATQRGQLLGYFTLLCILAVLGMVLAGELLVDLAPPEYADAAPLIPLAAAGFVMPAFYRTVNSNVALPRKRRLFIAGSVLAALLFFGVTAALAGPLGIYAAPVGLIAGFAVPSAYLFVRCQRGNRRIDFPYSETARALALALAVGAAYSLAIPPVPFLARLAIAVALLAVYLVLLFAFRVIPESHWRPLAHMARSVVRGTTERELNPRAGLRALPEDRRCDLRAAISQGLPAERLRTDEGAELVASLRAVGVRAGAGSMLERSGDEREVAVFLFEAAPTAVRNASMRRLLAEGADSNQLRALEDLVLLLGRVPDDAWHGAHSRRRIGGLRLPGRASS